MIQTPELHLQPAAGHRARQRFDRFQDPIDAGLALLQVVEDLLGIDDRAELLKRVADAERARHFERIQRGIELPRGELHLRHRLRRQRQRGGNPDIVPDGHLVDFLKQRTQLNVFEGRRRETSPRATSARCETVSTVLSVSRAFLGAEQQHDV